MLAQTNFRIATMYCSPIAQEALNLLKNRPRTLTIEKIASDTELTPGWLRSFEGGRIREPGLYKVERLYSYLAKKPIQLV